MTTMDEIRELLSEYANDVFERGMSTGSTGEAFPPNGSETSARASLLQAVESVANKAEDEVEAARAAMESAVRRAEAAEKERDEAREAHRLSIEVWNEQRKCLDAAESALAETREALARVLAHMPKRAKKMRALAKTALAPATPAAPAKVPCPDCSGTGIACGGANPVQCEACGGLGDVPSDAPPAALRPPENKEDPRG